MSGWGEMTELPLLADSGLYANGNWQPQADSVERQLSGRTACRFPLTVRN
jgi:hypothetical protein